MYSNVPTRVALNVNCVAGTATGALIAAPGANRAIRLMGVTCSINRLVTGLTDIFFYEGNTATGNTILRAGALSTTNGGGSDSLMFPFPGFQFAENLALNYDVISTAGAGGCVLVAYYYIDDRN